MTKSKLHEALEKKNAADFAEISARIESAIERIRTNPKIKPSQDELAKLSGCSRGTINNRKWPLEQLKKIKADRIEAANTFKEQHPPISNEVSEIEQYKIRLQNNRDELHRWKSRSDDLALKLTQLGEINRTLQSRIEFLELELLELRKENNSGNVVDIRTNKKQLKSKKTPLV